MLALAAVLIAGALLLTGCTTSGETSQDTVGEEGVAATVNGVAIPEDEVTAYVQSYRAQLGCADDSRWSEVLAAYQTDASTVRRDIINGVFVVNETVRQEAEKQGVTATDEEVDAAVEGVRDSRGFAGDDAGWESYLASIGSTDEQYRQEVEAGVLKEKLCEANLDNPTDEEIRTSLLENLGTYATRKSSYIAFTDEATAAKVHDELVVNGNLDESFKVAVHEYSTDGGKYADADGNVGWDVLKPDTLPKTYEEALSGLSAGQLSSVIHDSDNGVYYVIYCTDEFATGDTSRLTLDDIPDELWQPLYDSEESYLWSDRCDRYIDDLVSEQDVVIYDMPSGLPYDVS